MTDIPEYELLKLLAQRIHRARTRTMLANPDTINMHVLFGRDILHMFQRHATPQGAGYPWEPGHASFNLAVLTGTHVIDGSDTLPPNAWQLRDQHSTIIEQGTLTDLETQWTLSAASSDDAAA